MSDGVIILGLLCVIGFLLGVAIAQRATIRRRTDFALEALALCERYSEKAARDLEIIKRLAERLQRRTGQSPHKLHLLDQALRQLGLWYEREALIALVERLTKEIGE